jgi:hypothetical protein
MLLGVARAGCREAPSDMPLPIDPESEVQGRLTNTFYLPLCR